MIRNIRGMILATWEMSDRVQAGRVHKFARSQRRPPEPCVTVQLAEHAVLAAHTTGVRPEEPTRRGVIRMQASRDGTGCRLPLSDA